MTMRNNIEMNEVFVSANSLQAVSRSGMIMDNNAKRDKK